MVEQAVILAAGMGTRLGSAGADEPKGFLRLGELPIVEESVLRLRAAGVDRVVIVTGHRAERYEELAARYPSLVATVHNPSFASSGSTYSLYLARSALSGPFLLLESDLIYEPRALTVLLQGEADAVLLSGPTGAGDEVHVEVEDGRLVSMSKDRRELGTEPAGELVGISRISPELFGVMVDVAESAFQRSLHHDYETGCLVEAAALHPISCPLVPDLLWAEIDDARHLRRAREDVYPRLPPVHAGP